MIVIGKERLKFLLSGRELDIQLAKQPKRPYRPNRVYAVGLSHRHSTCHAEILHVADTDGLVTLRIRHAPAAADVPRMLQRGSGYTHLGDPLDAGEALSADELERYGREGRQRYGEMKRSERDRLSLADRLRDLERRADAGEQQARRHLFVIRQRVEAAERREARS